MLCRDLVYVCCLLVRFVGLEVEGGKGGLGGWGYFIEFFVVWGGAMVMEYERVRFWERASWGVIRL